MTHFKVKGMSCAACSARVEKAVRAVPGVTDCSVSLLTNSMGVEGTATADAIIKAVKAAGYGASLKKASSSSSSSASGNSDELTDTETPRLKRRLVTSVVFLVILMYFSMGHMMFNLPLPSFLEGNHISVGLIQLLLTVIIMVINQRFFISGFSSLIRKAPNMDTLVALGSGASFIWSVYALFAMSNAVHNGNHAAAAIYMDELYFESAAMILTLITVGKTLEAKSKGKTTDALKSLMQLTPQTAVIVKNGKELIVPATEVKIDDIFIVKPGSSIPVDGIIIEGSTAVNEAALTGESIPADKTVNDYVSAATINQSGFIKCRATRVGEDTTLAQIIKTVSDAAATSAPIARTADKVSGIFVPAVICISLITFIVWMILGKDFAFSLARGISVLVISCPCALGLATPVAVMVANGVGARSGILFKTAASIEHTGKITTVALDKTGTVTTGRPVVTDIIPTPGFSKDYLLTAAASIEIKSEHPLAKAVTEKAKNSCGKMFEVTDFSALPGNGITAVADSKNYLGGSLKFISERIIVEDNIKAEINRLSESGKTPLLFTENSKLMGIIAVADTVKDEAPAAVKELKALGINVVMVTGDNQKTAEAIGKIAEVDNVTAGVLPNEKEAVIKQLKSKTHKEYVAMVGDGINDAPALTRADVGIAIGAGTDIAIDAADVVLMKSKLSDVPAAIRLSRAALRNIHQNLFWAFIYNIIGIPLAAGCFIPLGFTLNPMFGAAAMSLSSFCVVSNALRLNFFKMNKSKH